MALQGSLADIALPDVIQLVSVSGKTGVFTLSAEGSDGKIFLRDGQITDAIAGRLRGEYAIYEMATWRRGQFIFTANVESDQVTINKSNTSLMMEAARRMDEWRVLQRKIPSMEMVPYFLPREPGHDQITLSPQEWTIVTKIDGQTSIKKLEELTALSAFDVCKVLYGLVTSGLIGLRSPEEKAAPVQAAPAGPSLRTLVALADNIRKVADECVGLTGSLAVEKQYRQTRSELEAGRGLESIQGLVDRLARAISLLEGGDKAGEFLRRVTPMIQS
ncbi:MAG TPA: DUF4388 domain-containing protein [Thermoanaerobaculaceae bacterium]|nr:DUF4388 domain-containing protein [Thermoanaerobaculaceae bacterium]HRS15624.1 DUF4388 domain-containing protein [Thermoanaerobaculaceae bacterium]